MPSPLQGWEFFIQELGQFPELLPGVYFQEVEDYNFSDEQEEGQQFKRRHLETTFVFQDAGYDRLLEIRQGLSPSGNAPCDTLFVRILYNGNPEWRGTLNLRELSWFPERCQAIGNVDTDDDVQRIYNEWEKPYNLLAQVVINEITATALVGTIETCNVIIEQENDPDLAPFPCNHAGAGTTNNCPDCTGMTLIRHEVFEVGTKWDYEETYAREVATTTCSGGVPVPPPGEGWILVTDDCAGTNTAIYAREVAVTVDTINSYSYPGGEKDQRWDIVGWDADNGEVNTYDNGVLLREALLFFFTLPGLSSYTLKSDFLDINPPGTAPVNAPYAASVALHDSAVWQKTDIKTPNVGNNATIAEGTLKQFLDMLRVTCNMWWRMEGLDFRLEHLSYFEGVNGDDLLATQPELVANRSTHDFDVPSLYDSETWQAMDATPDEDFTGLPVDYNNSCSNDEDITYQVGEFSFDVSNIQNNPDVVNEGFVFMALDEDSGNYYINREIGVLSGDLKLNGHLAFSNLLPTYHTYGRMFEDGNMNGVDVSFVTWLRSKRQQPITVFYSNADYLALDTEQRLNTEMGWGDIETGNYSARTCELEIILLQDD